MQHYAFLVDDELFERAYSRLLERGIPHWADPRMSRPGETNTEHVRGYRSPCNATLEAEGAGSSRKTAKY